MERNSIHINGKRYDAVSVLEEWISSDEVWKVKGLEFLIQLLDPSEFPVKFYTSGTTGTPKEISFLKKQIFESAKNTNAYFGIKASSRLLLCLPTDFVAGRLMIARAFAAGAELMWEEPSLDPLKNDVEIDFAAFTPAQVANIISKEPTRTFFKKIKKVIIGGGEISYQLEQELMKFDNEIYATYGMTETLTHIAVRKIGDPIYHSIFNEAVFATDENGCLVIDLPFIMEEKIVTRDVVELINKNSFVWKGRVDNVINTGGVKLYAEDIEAILVKSGVLKQSEFYIAAKKDNIFGESPVIVMLKQDKDFDVAALLTLINGLLNKHASVKGVVFLDKFEVTSTGKLKRQRF